MLSWSVTIQLGSFSVGAYDSGVKTSLIMAMLFKHPDKDTWHWSKIARPTSGREFMACMLPIRKFVDAVLDPGAVGERTLSKDKTFKMVPLPSPAPLHGSTSI